MEHSSLTIICFFLGEDGQHGPPDIYIFIDMIMLTDQKSWDCYKHKFDLYFFILKSIFNSD